MGSDLPSVRGDGGRSDRPHVLTPNPSGGGRKRQERRGPPFPDSSPFHPRVTSQTVSKCSWISCSHRSSLKKGSPLLISSTLLQLDTTVGHLHTSSKIITTFNVCQDGRCLFQVVPDNSIIGDIPRLSSPFLVCGRVPEYESVYSDVVNVINATLTHH